MDTLETERLRLRPFVAEDLDAYYAGISRDADVMRYLPGGQPRQRSDSQWVINYFRNHEILHGFGIWAVEELASGTLIGHAGLEYIPGSEKIEIAYTFAKAYWGRGYATEAGGASLEYGFEYLNLPEVYGLAFPANTASQNVMRKLGMEAKGITHEYYGLELTSFYLARERYFAAKQGIDC